MSLARMPQLPDNNDLHSRTAKLHVNPQNLRKPIHNFTKDRNRFTNCTAVRCHITIIPQSGLHSYHLFPDNCALKVITYVTTSI